jgi:hypothetical protein
MTIGNRIRGDRWTDHRLSQARNSLAGPLALACCLAMAMAMIGGCRKAGPDVQPVEGTVLLDGKELDGATVGFTPADGAGIPAVGMTGPDGRFKLTSTGGGRPETGAVAGDYKVVITKQEVEGTGKPVEEPAMAPPPSTAYPKQPQVTFIVPQGYEKAESSGLRATVKRGNNTFRFELDSRFNPK